MARKIFLSFLGTNNYTASKYFIKEQETVETRFVQIASLKFHCADFDENDKIFIFTTPTANERNWKDDFEFTNFKTQEKERHKGLKTEFEKQNLKSEITAIEVPEETSEEKYLGNF